MVVEEASSMGVKEGEGREEKTFSLLVALFSRGREGRRAGGRRLAMRVCAGEGGEGGGLGEAGEEGEGEISPVLRGERREGGRECKR